MALLTQTALSIALLLVFFSTWPSHSLPLRHCNIVHVVNFVSQFLHAPTIDHLSNAFFTMLRAHFTLASSFTHLFSLVFWLLTLIPIKLVLLTLIVASLAIIFILAIIWSFGVQKSNPMSPAPVVNLNIVLWHSTLLNLIGLRIFSSTSKFPSRMR